MKRKTSPQSDMAAAAMSTHAVADTARDLLITAVKSLVKHLGPHKENGCLYLLGHRHYLLPCFT